MRGLQPNDPDSYYASRELVPNDMLGDIDRAKIKIVNYHAFKLRERLEISKVGRLLLQGRGEEFQTLQTEGQMRQRVHYRKLSMSRCKFRMNQFINNFWQTRIYLIILASKNCY